jgi:hypothetical protein
MRSASPAPSVAVCELEDDLGLAVKSYDSFSWFILELFLPVMFIYNDLHTLFNIDELDQDLACIDNHSRSFRLTTERYNWRGVNRRYFSPVPNDAPYDKAFI